MNKAEKVLLDNIRDILGNGSWDRNPRPMYSDGVPAYTKFITDVFEKYEADEVPITEARRIAWKSGIRELLAIYQTQTNTQEGFESHKVGWWKDWMNEEGNLNKAYAYNLESHPYESNREMVEVKERRLPIILKEPVSIKVRSLEPAVEEYAYFNLLEIDKENRRYKMQDKRTGEIGWVSKNKYKDLSLGGDITRDNGKGFEWLYLRKFYSVGYLGDYHSVKNFSNGEVEKLKRKWINMLKRCYTAEYEQNYKDIWVHYRWHSFENFLRDIRMVPQFFLARREKFIGWELDKDYYNSNFYAPETTVFLRSEENKSLNDYRVKAYNKNSGQVLYFPSTTEFANLFGFSQGTSAGVLNGKKNSIHGWKLSRETAKNNGLLRKELSRNQINELLYNLEHNKFSRRHIISFFNWANNDKKMLVECAYETMWTVREKNGKTILDLHLNQRSSDYLTAGHINLVQYKALQMMVAKHLGYEVGTFSRHVMNMHIYDRHMVNIEPILSAINKIDKRDTRPEFILDVPDKTNFYDIKETDFVMKNYHPVKHDPKLRFDLGI